MNWRLKRWGEFMKWFSEHFQNGDAVKPVGYWDHENWKAVPPSVEAIERFNNRYPNELPH